MPGIAGVIGKRVSTASKSVVARMISTMRHESSYVYRVQYATECKACVGWVAHPGSFANRVSGSAGGDLELAFSGECFNTSGSVRDPNEPDFLLETYRQRGSSFISELNGLFSGALLDKNAGRTYLFLDRFASERIYYHWLDDTLYFASEAKALLAVLPVLREFDEEGVADFLAFGSCRDTRTLFRGISRLVGGSLWTFDAGGGVKRDSYFDASVWESLEPLTIEHFESAFVETAKATVPRYSEADTEVGFSITGGLDTRMILACLPAQLPNLTCYTYGAADGDTLDVRIGRKVAKSLGYSHETLRIDDLFLQQFQDYLDRSIYISDGCAGALTAHELFFSQQARNIAPVRLTGNYGSEVFRSMSTLKPMSPLPGFLDAEFSSRVSDRAGPIVRNHPLTATVFEEIPSHLFGPLAIARSQLIFRTPYLDNSLVKLAYQAPQSSRQSPAAALRLIASGHEHLSRLPTDLGYACRGRSPAGGLRRLFRKISFKLDYWDKEGLPPDLSILDSCRPLLDGLAVLGQHKFLPYRRWLKRELLSVIDSATKRAASGNQPWWNPETVARMADEHASGKRNFLREISAILSLDAVERVLISSAKLENVSDCTGSKGN